MACAAAWTLFPSVRAHWNIPASGIAPGDILIACRWRTPALNPGDLLLYRVHPLNLPAVRIDPGLITGTLIGREGDRIEVHGGQIRVNGVPLPTPHCHWAPDLSLTVPRGHLAAWPSLQAFEAHGDEMDAALREALPQFVIVPNVDAIGRIVARRRGVAGWKRVH